jgi:hypothetical protein
VSESDWVTIVHPETGGQAEVHRLSLPQHYTAGWRLLADDETPEPEPPPAPPAMTRAQAAKAAKQAAAAEAESEEN